MQHITQVERGCCLRPAQKHHMEGGELRAALLQSAVSTPTSSCATAATAAVAAVIKDEAATAAVHCGVEGVMQADLDSDGGKSTRTSALKDGAGSVPPPGHARAPPPRAAALAASATVAKMAAAESAAMPGGALPPWSSPLMLHTGVDH